MKIKRLDFSRLQNAEHFQFHADILAIAGEANPAAAKFEAQLTACRVAFAEEDKIIKPIEASSITKLIAAADTARDETFRSLMATHRAAAIHFNNALREAAANTRPVFKAFSNITTESFAKQSADTYNFIQELRTNYAEECETLGIEPWLDELDRNNQAVEALVRQRDAESAQRRRAAEMREVRRSVDDAWRNLAVCIEALAIMETGNTAAALAAMIARINVTIERYATAIAIRRGRAAAKKEGAAAEQQLIEN